MELLQKCINFAPRFSAFVYVGMHESFTPPPDSAGKDVKAAPKELSFAEKLKKAESDMESNVEAAKKNLEEKFEEGGADAVAATAKTEIGKNRDSIVGSINGLPLPSGPSSANERARIDSEQAVKHTAENAMNDIDKAAKVFKAKKEYAEIDTDLKVNVQPKWNTLDTQFNGMESWKNFSVAITTPAEKSAVDGYFTSLNNMVTEGQALGTTIDKKIAQLIKLKGIDEGLTKDIDHYLTNVLEVAKKRVDTGVKSARTTYNAKLAELQAYINDPESAKKAQNKSRELQTASGVAQGKMDKGEMSSKERVEAYNQYDEQKKFAQQYKQFAAQIAGRKPLSGAAEGTGEVAA